MYAYIPSPFGGRLPSYALAKADRPVEPKAEEPKVEEPKEPAAGPKTEPAAPNAPVAPEAGAPKADAPADGGQQAQDSTTMTHGKVGPESYDWVKVFEQASKLNPDDQRLFNRRFKRFVESKGDDARQIVQEVGGRVGLSANDFLLDPAVPDAQRRSVEAYRNRFGNETFFGREGDAGGRGPRKDYVESDKVESGESKYHPLSTLKRQTVDENGKAVYEYSSPVAAKQARQKRQDAKLLEEGKRSRGEARQMTENLKFKGNPERMDMTINQEGEGVETGKSGVNFVGDVTDKGAVKEASQDLGTMTMDDGRVVTVRHIPTRSANKRFITDTFVDTNYDVIDPSSFSDKEIEQYNKILNDPESRKKMMRGMPGERTYVDYKDNTKFRDVYFHGGTLTPRGKYNGYLADIGEGIYQGAVINPTTNKPEPIYTLSGSASIPIPVTVDEKGNINTTQTLTPQQEKAIQEAYRNFHPYTDANGNVLTREDFVEPKPHAPTESDPPLQGKVWVLDKNTGQMKMGRRDVSTLGNVSYGEDVEINGKKYKPVVNIRNSIMGYIPVEEEVKKSATMIMRDLSMPSIGDMISARRNRSAPFPSLIPLGRALP